MKTILITGTSRGIGKETALLSLEKGWNVYGVSRTEGNITHPQFTHIPCDVASKDFLDTLPKIENIDALCINAGVGYFRPLENLRILEIDEMIATNIRAPFLIARHFLSLIKKSRGHILIIGSESALQGGKMGTVYCATKAAVKMFGEALFAEVRNSGAKITTIHPGVVNSTWFKDKDFAPEKGEEYSIDPQEIAEVILDVVQKQSVIREITVFPQKNAIRKKDK